MRVGINAIINEQAKTFVSKKILWINANKYEKIDITWKLKKKKLGRRVNNLIT